MLLIDDYICCFIMVSSTSGRLASSHMVVPLTTYDDDVGFSESKIDVPCWYHLHNTSSQDGIINVACVENLVQTKKDAKTLPEKLTLLCVACDEISFRSDSSQEEHELLPRPSSNPAPRRITTAIVQTCRGDHDHAEKRETNIIILYVDLHR